MQVLEESLERMVQFVGSRDLSGVSLEGQELIHRLIESNPKWTDKDKEWIRIFVSRIVNGLAMHGAHGIQDLHKSRDLTLLNQTESNECIYHYHESISTPIHQLREMLAIKRAWGERATIATIFYSILITLLIVTIVLVAVFWKRIEFKELCAKSSRSSDVVVVNSRRDVWYWGGIGRG